METPKDELTKKTFRLAVVDGKLNIPYFGDLLLKITVVRPTDARMFSMVFYPNTAEQSYCVPTDGVLHASTGDHRTKYFGGAIPLFLTTFSPVCLTLDANNAEVDVEYGFYTIAQKNTLLMAAKHDVVFYMKSKAYFASCGMARLLK